MAIDKDFENLMNDHNAQMYQGYELCPHCHNPMSLLWESDTKLTYVCRAHCDGFTIVTYRTAKPLHEEQLKLAAFGDPQNLDGDALDFLFEATGQACGCKTCNN